MLGDRWPGANSVDDRDYFQYNTDDDIIISVWFDETQEVRGDVGPFVPFHGIQLHLSRTSALVRERTMMGQGPPAYTYLVSQ